MTFLSGPAGKVSRARCAPAICRYSIESREGDLVANGAIRTAARRLASLPRWGGIGGSPDAGSAKAVAHRPSDRGINAGADEDARCRRFQKTGNALRVTGFQTVIREWVVADRDTACRSAGAAHKKQRAARGHPVRPLLPPVAAAEVVQSWTMRLSAADLPLRPGTSS